MALEKLARKVRPSGSVLVQCLDSTWEITVFRTRMDLDHSHYQGASLIEAICKAHAGEHKRDKSISSESR